MSRMRHIGVVPIERYGFMASCLAEGCMVLGKKKVVSAELFPPAVIKTAKRFLKSALSFTRASEEPNQVAAGTNYFYAVAALRLAFKNTERYSAETVEKILSMYLFFLELIELRLAKRIRSTDMLTFAFRPESIALFFRGLERSEEVKRELRSLKVRVPLN